MFGDPPEQQHEQTQLKHGAGRHQHVALQVLDHVTDEEAPYWADDAVAQHYSPYVAYAKEASYVALYEEKKKYDWS